MRRGTQLLLLALACAAAALPAALAQADDEFCAEAVEPGAAAAGGWEMLDAPELPEEALNATLAALAAAYTPFTSDLATSDLPPKEMWPPGCEGDALSVELDGCRQVPEDGAEAGQRFQLRLALNCSHTGHWDSALVEATLEEAADGAWSANITAADFALDDSHSTVRAPCGCVAALTSSLRPGASRDNILPCCRLRCCRRHARTCCARCASKAKTSATCASMAPCRMPRQVRALQCVAADAACACICRALLLLTPAMHLPAGKCELPMAKDAPQPVPAPIPMPMVGAAAPDPTAVSSAPPDDAPAAFGAAPEPTSFGAPAGTPVAVVGGCGAGAFRNANTGLCAPCDRPGCLDCR